MSPTWDYSDIASDEERNEWAVRDQLRASWLLRHDDVELEEMARARVRALLDSVVPGPPVCSYVPRWKPREGEPVPGPCGAPGARLVALSGTWFCAVHDPLRQCGTPCETGLFEEGPCRRHPNHLGAHQGY